MAIDLSVLPGLFAVALAVLGLLLGSFLNVVIARVPKEESIVFPGSHCPKCGHALAWYENIPVLSWVFLRGRCLSCRAPISLRYPAIELLTCALFVACLRRFSWSWELVRVLVLVMFLVPLTFIDLDHWILPFELTLPGLALGLLSAIPLGWSGVASSLAGAAIGFLTFWSMEWVGQKAFKKEALGGGDKYLLAMIASYLGPASLLGIVFLSSLQASIVGITMLLIHGRAGPAPKPETEPSGPQASADVAAAGSKPGDAPKDEEQEDDWVPGPTNLPLGPWLALAAIEIMLFAPSLRNQIAWPMSLLFGVGR